MFIKLVTGWIKLCLESCKNLSFAGEMKYYIKLPQKVQYVQLQNNGTTTQEKLKKVKFSLWRWLLFHIWGKKAETVLVMVSGFFAELLGLHIIQKTWSNISSTSSPRSRAVLALSVMRRRNLDCKKLEWFSIQIRLQVVSKNLKKWTNVMTDVL